MMMMMIVIFCYCYCFRCGCHSGRVAAFARSRMNDSIPFERAIEQITGTMSDFKNN